MRFGAGFARRLRRRRPRPGDTRHLDEAFLRISGELHHLWRAVDQHGVVLDSLVQDRRNATAAKRSFERLLKELRYKPRRLITDGLRSYGAARREVLPEVRHRTGRHLNNRGENSHRPTRRRERQAAGAPDAAVQVPRADAALPLIPRHDLRPLPPAASSDGR